MREIIRKLLSVSVAKVLRYYGFLVRGRGESSKILCPFHEETHPSFLVNLDRNFCYCFGCAKSWDSIGLIREFDKCSFLEALLKLCEIGGYKKLTGVDLKKIFAGFKRVRTETFSDQQAHAYHKFAMNISNELRIYHQSLSTYEVLIPLFDYLYQEFDQLLFEKLTQWKFDQVKDWFHRSKRELKNAHSCWKKLPALKREAYFDRVNFKV